MFSGFSFCLKSGIYVFTLSSRLRNFRFRPREERALKKLRKRLKLATDTEAIKVAVLVCLDRGDDVDPVPHLEELKRWKS